MLLHETLCLRLPHCGPFRLTHDSIPSSNKHYTSTSRIMRNHRQQKSLHYSSGNGNTSLAAACARIFSQCANPSAWPIFGSDSARQRASQLHPN